MNNNKKKKDKGYTVYVPPGIDPNFEAQSADPPKTRYENRRKAIDIDAVKKVVGGKYGRSGS